MYSSCSFSDVTWRWYQSSYPTLDKNAKIRVFFQNAMLNCATLYDFLSFFGTSPLKEIWESYLFRFLWLNVIKQLRKMVIFAMCSYMPINGSIHEHIFHTRGTKPGTVWRTPPVFTVENDGSCHQPCSNRSCVSS